MNYNSLRFLSFVSHLLLFYFIVPKKIRPLILLGGSCVYYWMNSRLLCLALLLGATVTYICGRFIGERINNSSERKAAKSQVRPIFVFGLLVNLSLLISLKYFSLPFLNNYTLSRSSLLPSSGVLIPLGISFYTLQTIGYLIDVFRGKAKAEKSYLHFLLFILYFPQILQGPIARYNELAPQLSEGQSFDYSAFTDGAQLALWGYMKKLILADRIAPVISFFFNVEKNITGAAVFFGAILYSVRIYADFSGGIDIARGISQMFGIKLSENFRQPYLSRSIEAFWRRWHISLGAWMREYVFYPLSLSKPLRKLGHRLYRSGQHFAASHVPSILSLFVVWALVGLWHGPEFKYLVYGLWNGFLICLDLLLRRPFEKMKNSLHVQNESIPWKVFQILRTFLLCTFGRYFVLAPNVSAAFKLMGRSFQNVFDLAWLSNGTLLDCGLNSSNWNVVIAAVFLLILTDCLHEKGISIRKRVAALPLPLRWSVYIAAGLSVLIFGIYGPGYDPAAFVYGTL